MREGKIDIKEKEEEAKEEGGRGETHAKEEVLFLSLPRSPLVCPLQWQRNRDRKREMAKGREGGRKR